MLTKRPALPQNLNNRDPPSLPLPLRRYTMSNKLYTTPADGIPGDLRQAKRIKETFRPASSISYRPSPSPAVYDRERMEGLAAVGARAGRTIRSAATIHCRRQNIKYLFPPVLSLPRHSPVDTDSPPLLLYRSYPRSVARSRRIFNLCSSPWPFDPSRSSRFLLSFLYGCISLSRFLDSLACI